MNEKKVKFCKSCVYPDTSAVPLQFDEEGICSGCKVNHWKHGQKFKIDWEQREEVLIQILEEYKSKDQSNYDCLIPVSGGKDSHYQVHYIKEKLGYNPLLVTYDHQNFTKTGLENLENISKVFKVDHLIFKANPDLIKKLNIIALKKMGDMCWHCHTGIFTYPVQVAVKYKIPLIIWGEQGYLDYGGMFSYNDMIEMTKKFRTEHTMRGYDWHDMIDEDEGITKADLKWAVYPSDEELEEADIRGIYLGNFIKWNAEEHGKLMTEKYGFKPWQEEQDRTFTKYSNVECYHCNGIHDWLKYLKFGYGRATDHACKWIRTGQLTREEALKLVKKHDSVKPRDLQRWLKFVGMTEKEFDEIAEKFRNQKIWHKDENGEWQKDNAWD